MFQVYVIENHKGKKYTGSTVDISERLKMHNNLSPEKAKSSKDVLSLYTLVGF